MDNQAYRIFRKNLSKIKYKAKRTYFYDLLNEAKNSEDKRAIWDFINRAFGKNKKKWIYPDKVATDDRQTQKSQKILKILQMHWIIILQVLLDTYK